MDDVSSANGAIGANGPTGMLTNGTKEHEEDEIMLNGI